MGIDHHEAKRRGQSGARTTTNHRYAAVEHRVIDSPAFADLTFSARSLLLVITRQLTRDNNGHLQATFSYMRRFGFDSDRTVTRAVADLIAHGFIYRTRTGGYQQGAAQYAVTWLSISRKEGLFLDGFKPCAWRYWTPERSAEKKTPLTKMRHLNRKNDGLTQAATDIFAADGGVKSTDIELMPVGVAKTPLLRLWIGRQHRLRDHTNSPRPRLKTGIGYLGLST